MNESKPDIARVIEFHKLLFRFRDIERKVRLPYRLDTFENDVEHSYSLAMMAWYLCGHFPELDRDAVIRFALAHDLVEIHAGDTFPYGDPAHVASKHRREMEALEQLQNEWEDFPEMTQTIEQYEKRDTAEAKFVYALDKILPTIMNFLGKGHGWREHNLTIDDVRKEKETKAAVSPEVNDYYRQLMKLLEQNNKLFG